MDQPVTIAEPTPSEEGASLRRRVAHLASRVAAWSMATRLRMALMATVSLGLLGVMFATWSYLAHLAVAPIDPAPFELALAALDEGRYDDAESLIGRLQQQPATPELLGGAMFVLGSVKQQEAGKELSQERRGAIYQLAARYLAKARALGVPEGRQGRCDYLLGLSLARGGQFREAISALEDALGDSSQPRGEIHLLLSRALLEAPDPNLQAALEHLHQVVADQSLAEEDRQNAWIIQAETLLAMKRPADAREALDRVGAEGPFAAARALMLGRLEVAEAGRLAADSSQRDAKMHAAISHFRTARQLDGDAGPVSRQAMYWIAKCHEQRGEHEAALAEYDRLRKLYAETAEGVAATLAEADHHRRTGQHDRALAGYRAVLTSVADPIAYQNPLLSLSDLRQRLTAAYQDYVDGGFFNEATALVEGYEPVFDRASCVELRARTQQQWGLADLARASAEDRWQTANTRKSGLAHLREAGVAFEGLARLRPASPSFTEDLWTAADCYFQGHSYTNAARVLKEYLHHEARRRNATALLRLGQAHLAGDDLDQAVAALSECIELFPRDAIAYQARLECARAYQQRGDFSAAEQLLLANLSSEALTPDSPEWRDSKFALGRLLYQSERYDESIATLREAVLRYPEDDAALLAKYTMARAYHNASEFPAKRLQEAKTEDERQKNRQSVANYLDLAHATYQEVQRAITDRGRAEGNPLDDALLRNCYMMQGSVLFELRRFEESRQAYGSVITFYQNDPIVLECFVQAANCWRRLAQPVKARVMLEQARMVLDRLPEDADFLASTNFNRQQWELLLSQMSKW